MNIHTSITPTDDATMQTRIDLAAAYRLIHRLGLDDSIYTHISVRLPGSHDRFLINPYGMRFEEVTASNLVTVDINGEVIDDPLGLGINPAGFTIHSAVHAARHDALCVLHTHTVAGVAVACQKGGLLPLNQWSMQFTGKIAYHDFEGIALDLSERERLVADLGEKFVLILRNHGLLTCGRSVGEAFKLMHNMERSCRAQLALQASGAEIEMPSQAIALHTASQYARGYEKIEVERRPDSEWAAFKRMLDRTDPEYKS
ncbi:class II aldolase/adducin family protein [Tardiphaga sp.]|uniref:class II aldolase/adducin family protein n=1 Tax=Tardiphaga sp. TaxID=1926292 RepID=UPI0026049383|nr:class II aldolase/adducin family protein [Tardiphaga sp.]MDB5619477.1 Class aldolase/adducin-like [Tardiphaga sp.]